MGKIYFLFFEIISISISIIFCQFCGINPAEDKSYCGNYWGNNETHNCCYCQSQKTGVHYCLFAKTEDPNITEYNCDCKDIPENEDLPGAGCLDHTFILENSEKISKGFCHDNSKDDKHPCCYYDDGDFKMCFGIGKITSYTFYTYNEFLDCFSKCPKVNFFLIFSFIFFFNYF